MRRGRVCAWISSRMTPQASLLAEPPACPHISHAVDAERGENSRINHSRNYADKQMRPCAPASVRQKLSHHHHDEINRKRSGKDNLEIGGSKHCVPFSTVIPRPATRLPLRASP